MATFSSVVFRRLMRTTSMDRTVFQLQSKRITDNLSDLCPTRVEQNGSKPFEVHMPCPFTGPKMFCASPNVLSQPKYLTAFSAASKTFVPAQKQFY